MLSHAALVRIRAGHTQASLAAATRELDGHGVSKRTIARIEGGAAPSAATAIRISRALGHADPLVVFPDLLVENGGMVR